MKNRLATLALFSVLCFIAGCMPEGIVIRPAPADRRLQEQVLHKDAGMFVRDKVAVIDIDGVMMNSIEGGWFGGSDNPVSLFLEKLQRAEKDPSVKAVVLRLNSPGGSVGASDIMHRALLDFKKKTKKPVVSCMLDVAASGAYYLACGSDGIVAQPTSVTGSIGTVMHTVSFAGIMNKLGIKAETIKSGKMKDIGSPFHDLSEDEREILSEIILEFYEGFIDVVVAGRENLTPDTLRPLADGRVYTAKQALENGLIDKIGYPDDAVEWAKRKAGLDRTQTIIYHRPLATKSNIYASAEKPATGAALINLELPRWLNAQGPQFLYLWDGYLE